MVIVSPFDSDEGAPESPTGCIGPFRGRSFHRKQLHISAVFQKLPDRSEAAGAVAPSRAPLAYKIPHESA